MEATFNVFSTILLLGTVQGFLLTFLLFSIKKNNRSANKFLAVFLLLISITMLGRLLIELSFFKKYPNFLALPDAIVFLYGPLMFLYLRRLLLKNKLSTLHLTLLFLPTLLFVLSEVPLILNEDNILKKLWVKHTRYRFIIIEGLAILFNLIFVILQIRLFTRYQRASDNNFSFRQYPHYLKTLYILIVIILFIWFLSYLSWVFGYYSLLSLYGYKTIWYILTAITYVLAYYAMKNPEFYKITFSNGSRHKKGIPKSEKQELIEMITNAMEKLELYKNPEFSLSLLSGKLSINRNKLSQLINEEFNKNFNEWTNDYRIDAAKTLLEKSNMSIKEIYYDIGYNSKSVFNKAFKSRVDTTPSEFRKTTNN